MRHRSSHEHFSANSLETCDWRFRAAAQFAKLNAIEGQASSALPAPIKNPVTNHPEVKHIFAHCHPMYFSKYKADDSTRNTYCVKRHHLHTSLLQTARNLYNHTTYHEICGSYVQNKFSHSSWHAHSGWLSSQKIFQTVQLVKYLQIELEHVQVWLADKTFLTASVRQKNTTYCDALHSHRLTVEDSGHALHFFFTKPTW